MFELYRKMFCIKTREKEIVSTKMSARFKFERVLWSFEKEGNFWHLVCRIWRNGNLVSRNMF